MHREAITSFSIQGLFEAGDQYLIPVYQRNYAWGLAEVKQLLQDINDYCQKSAKAEQAHNTPYYLGTLVVYEQQDDEQLHYETIDGQQRLTTLTLLLSALHRWCHQQLPQPINFNSKLRFYSRPKASATLHTITQALEQPVNFISSYAYDSNIQARYQDIENLLKDLFETPDSPEVQAFYQYFTQQVHLLRVAVPEKTDLNHYFEVMNNRGEQLEKHEVLKARLLRFFENDPEGLNTLNRIWRAVSDMERYVQYGFTTTERDLLFGEGMSNTPRWNYLQATDFGSCQQLLTSAEQNLGNQQLPQSIEDIVDYKGAFNLNIDHTDDAPERFTPVINFSGFLLHILRIFTQKDIPLDDKRLLETFEQHLVSKQAVEAFGYALLKGKHLFDQYVIKREFINEKEQWSLKRLKWYERNRIGYVNSIGHEQEVKDQQHQRVLMLQAMFHVSQPSINYKHWLSAALNYLFQQPSGAIEGQAFANYLFAIAQSYCYSRILHPNKKQELDYFPMIFEEGYKKPQVALEQLDWSRLNQGTAVENFAFNYLDYLLWLDKNMPYFEFTSRSSVEHYYPQNPIDTNKRMEDAAIDSFGNLCLISKSKNSRLSNYLPSAKKDHYKEMRNDSLKLRDMMELHNTDKPWDVKAIRAHEQNMRKLLEKHYPVDYAP